MDVLSRDQCEKYFESNRILLGAQTDNTRKCSSSNPVYGIKIEVFDVLAVLMGAYYGDIGFAGKIWLRSKVKNNTKYSFEKPISLFLTTKDCPVLEDKIGRKWPDKGVVLISDLVLDACEKSWKPGEEIVLTREIDIGSDSFKDNEWKFFKYLTKSLSLPANEPVKIDKFVSAFCDMSFSNSLGCFIDNYFFEKEKEKKPNTSSYVAGNCL